MTSHIDLGSVAAGQQVTLEVEPEERQWDGIVRRTKELALFLFAIADASVLLWIAYQVVTTR